MPCKRRYGNLQIGVSVALLRKEAATVTCLCVWPGGAVGKDRFAHPQNRKFLQPGTRIPSSASKTLGISSAAAIAATGDDELWAMGATESSFHLRRGRKLEIGAVQRKASHSMGRYVQQLLSSGTLPGRGGSAGGCRFHGDSLPASAGLRATTLCLRHAGASQRHFAACHECSR